MAPRTCLTALALVLSLPARSLAQPVAQPVAQPNPALEALLRHGVQLREQGDDLGALQEFERALSTASEPRVYAQIALAEQALGRWVPSAQHLREALRQPNDPWIQRNRGALEASLRVIEQHLGRVMVTSNVAGADVLVDGVRVATTPMTEAVEVRAGSCALEVRADGYFSLTRRVEVPPEGVAQEDARLVGSAGHAPPPPPPPPPPPAIVTRMNPTARAVGWITLGTAALVAGGAGFAMVLREDVVSQYNSNPACPGQLVRLQPASCDALLTDGDNERVLSVVGFGLAGALAATSAIVFLAAPRERVPARAPHTAMLCVPTVGAAGVSCAMTF